MSSFWKPFVTGAVVSVSTLLLLQQLLLVSRKTESEQQRDDSAARTRELKTRQQENNNNNNDNHDILIDSPHLDMRMIRKAEGAIQKRTSRITVVVERCTNDHNYSAILRTAEALGIQNVWIICPPQIRDDNNPQLLTMKGTQVNQGKEELEARKMHHLYAQRATDWLTVREFQSTTECLDELRSTGHTIWATDLSQEATCLTKTDLAAVQKHDEGSSSVLPPKVAIVFGTEAVGCTQEMLDGADLRVYLPLRGFADSLNLSVATALVVHHLFLLDPSLEGAMEEEERRELRQKWFPKLASQRLQAATKKKERARLQGALHKYEDMERKQATGHRMQKEQLARIASLPALRQELIDWDTQLSTQAQEAVAELIENPPAPITDMRRADEHRTWFGGKSTKKKNDWDNMPATTGYDTKAGVSTSDFFRSRVTKSVTTPAAEEEDSTV